MFFGRRIRRHKLELQRKKLEIERRNRLDELQRSERRYGSLDDVRRSSPYNARNERIAPRYDSRERADTRYDSCERPRREEQMDSRYDARDGRDGRDLPENARSTPLRDDVRERSDKRDDGPQRDGLDEFGRGIPRRDLSSPIPRRYSSPRDGPRDEPMSGSRTAARRFDVPDDLRYSLPQASPQNLEASPQDSTPTIPAALRVPIQQDHPTMESASPLNYPASAVLHPLNKPGPEAMQIDSGVPSLGLDIDEIHNGSSVV